MHKQANEVNGKKLSVNVKPDAMQSFIVHFVSGFLLLNVCAGGYSYVYGRTGAK